MAKVLIEDDSVDIRFTLLERMVLAERSRKLPLSRIRGVDPHPPLLDLMVHWSDQSGSWLCGVSAYDGHMVPSARHPGSTLAIDLDGDHDDDHERIYIEVDDESPSEAAERIERARASQGDGEARTSSMPPPERISALELGEQERRARQAALYEALDIELEEEDIRHRDPLMQGSLPPGPLLPVARVAELSPDRDRDLSRIGSWLIGIGSLALLGGGVMIATGALPGLLAVGAGVTAALLGGFALAVVARQQD